ncbi:amidase signature domain-containing protein [Pseudomassariella vexata]|uniref:Amidase signature domain-containing protein n=1 Tax=Pseudomassariella vexata TaxID=1141098 RepID=A0A1Y2DKC1_9PEZI|nr:amidase signature domain-containing protein [Pseudomassariella vexata]ORY59672.1 amidase signature domain-containing protein [Pseudomassariella vexata]
MTENGDIAALAQRIASGELNSEVVTRAYIHNAIAAQRLTNCLTEVLFEDALKQARELDAYQVQHGRVMGPLHGVPMTFKDQFNIKGYDTTMGYVGRTFQPAAEDAALVDMLKRLGAVVLAKTNLPQSIMWCETENPLWGLTTNPTSQDYTPGGSTGGESALLSLRGSIIGWGTDIGGSIRIPTHMMGLYGLKPSSARLPYWGVPVSTEGQEHVPSSVGPLARNLSSIRLVMKELILSRPWEFDARCAPIPWREDVYQEFRAKHLTVGLLVDDGVVRPHPPITRVLMAVVEKLKQAGHDIVEWNADLHPECIQVLDDFYTADGGEDIRIDVTAGGEPFIPHVEALVNKGKAISVYQYWQINKRKFALQQAYLNKWKSIKSPTTGRPVDVILMPAMPHPAVPHRSCRWVGYTKVWNVLDYSALVLPAGKVMSEDTEAQWNFDSRNELDDWNAAVWKNDGAQMAELALPVGIQLIGRKLEEEKVLAIGAVVDGILR